MHLGFKDRAKVSEYDGFWKTIFEYNELQASIHLFPKILLIKKLAKCCVCNYFTYHGMCVRWCSLEIWMAKSVAMEHILWNEGVDEVS